MTKEKVTATRRPLELLEESLQILRTGSAAILLIYWTGALPFAIAVLWLLRDTGFSWGSRLLLRDSLVCALCFLWMSYWKHVASVSTLSLLNPEAGSQVAWPLRICMQAIYQTSKLFVMPFAMTSLLGWPAATVFFRTLALEERPPVRAGLARAFAAATVDYRQNAVAFLTVCVFAVITFLNVLIALATLPSLWRMLTGYETDWSRMENSTAVFSLFGVAAIATWLLVDPWIQTYSILRGFYSNARSDGRDLLREIARLAAVALLCWLPLSAATVQEKALDRGIERASQDMNYGWLHPPDAKAPTGFLAVLSKNISNAYVAVRDRVKGWYSSLVTWLRGIFGGRPEAADESKLGKPRSQQLRWALALLAVLVCGGIIALFLRTGIRSTVPTQAMAAAAPAADVFNEQILPSDVNQDEWLRLASEYLASNQTRLAARAFYLANLSYLGANRLLSLALWKSNRMYERELARQPKSGDLSPAFVAGNRLYERAWYGMRELGTEHMEIIRGAAQQLRQHA